MWRDDCQHSPKGIFPHYGAVEVLSTDNGTAFVNSAVRDLCRACDVVRHTTTPYRSQMSAKVERFHRTLKGTLERLMVVNGSNWESHLGEALTAYRNTVSGATNHTPFQALYGRQRQVPLTKALRDGVEGYELEDDHMATTACIGLSGLGPEKHYDRNAKSMRRSRRESVRVENCKWATRSLSSHLE